jgi:hypothetical protein
MVDTYNRCSGDEEDIVREYPAAERRGEVPRDFNELDLSPEDYARRLLYDGLKKGWILGTR